MAYPYTIPNSFNNGEVIIADEHDENWNSIQTYVNGLSSGDNFVPGAIGTISLADNAVTNAKIAGSAVITAKIADSAVTTAKIADDAVTTAKIIDSAVTSAKIANDTIVNANINSAAGIVDTKLATIATAGKVSNSATTATSANTASAIVARDGSGNFSAGTITAALTGNVTGNLTGNVTGNVSGSSGSCSGNAATATLASKASTLAQGGGNGTAMTFNWSGQSGQPTWLWGSNDGSNHYVYNPSNFNVSYASSAGNADTVDGLHADENSNGSTVLARTSGGVGKAVAFWATGGGSSSFYDQGSNYTYLGLACMRVRNDDFVYSTVITSGRTVLVNSSQTLGTSASTRRVKENIQPYEDTTKKILTVSPVTFDYKAEVVEEEEQEKRFNQFGMIAEDLHEAGLNHLVHYDKDNQPEAINYMMLSVELLGVIKQQESVINDLVSRVTALEGR